MNRPPQLAMDYRRQNQTVNYVTDDILFFIEGRKRRMSSGCSYQDPKQPKVTSVEFAGSLLDILTIIES